MAKKRSFDRAVVLFILLSACACTATAADDGFGAAPKQEGAYFDVYYDPSVDVADLARRLDIRASDTILSGVPSGDGTKTGGELSDMVDTLFLQVSDILDMHIYSFRGTVKICSGPGHLNRVYLAVFGQDTEQTDSFYVFDTNTIYIAAASFQSSVLGHEMAHAVMSRFFVVAPPAKVSEVLAGYVEYQLKKTER